MNPFNRTLWTVFGAALALAGVAGLLGHFGWLPGIDSGDRLAPARVPGLTERPAPWPAVLGIGIGVVLVLLGLLLLWGQRPRRQPTRAPLTLPGEATPDGVAPGRTSVDPAVLDRALRRDLRRDPRVRRVRVRVNGTVSGVDLRLETRPDEDLNPLRDEVDGAVQRLGSTMSVRPSVTRVVVGTTRPPGRPSG